MCCKLTCAWQTFLFAMFDFVKAYTIDSPLKLSGKESSSDSYPLMEISKCMPEMEVRKGSKKAADVECHGHRSCNINAEK